MQENPDFIDEAQALFMARCKQQMSRQQKSNANSQRIKQVKDQQLQPFRKLLKRLVDMRIMVHHCSHHEFPGKPPQPFSVYENQSSESFRPGNSLYFDHPAQVEIAIPTNANQTREVVKIMCASPHPMSGLLQGPFLTARDAAMALSEFISLNTVCVEAMSDESGPSS